MARKLTDAERIHRAMSEADVQATIIETLRAMGALVFHPRRSLWSEPGYPDMTVVLPNKILWVEAKSEKGTLRPGRVAPKSGRWLPGQAEWLGAINQALPRSAWLVRPSTLDAFLKMLHDEH